MSLYRKIWWYQGPISLLQFIIASQKTSLWKTVEYLSGNLHVKVTNCLQYYYSTVAFLEACCWIFTRYSTCWWTDRPLPVFTLDRNDHNINQSICVLSNWLITETNSIIIKEFKRTNRVSIDPFVNAMGSSHFGHVWREVIVLHVGFAITYNVNNKQYGMCMYVCHFHLQSVTTSEELSQSHSLLFNNNRE